MKVRVWLRLATVFSESSWAQVEWVRLRQARCPFWSCSIDDNLSLQQLMFIWTCLTYMSVWYSFSTFCLMYYSIIWWVLLMLLPATRSSEHWRGRQELLTSFIFLNKLRAQELMFVFLNLYEEQWFILFLLFFAFNGIKNEERK